MESSKKDFELRPHVFPFQTWSFVRGCMAAHVANGLSYWDDKNTLTRKYL